MYSLSARMLFISNSNADDMSPLTPFTTTQDSHESFTGSHCWVRLKTHSQFLSAYSFVKNDLLFQGTVEKPLTDYAS